MNGSSSVRRFQQDDGHTFCRRDQIKTEVGAALDFMQKVYDTFGMTYKLELSTRPAKALGDVAIWNEVSRSVGRSVGRSVSQSVGRSVGLSVGRSFGRSVG